jgi:hypothetical protein
MKKFLGAAAASIALACALAAGAQQYPYHWLEDSTVSITTGNSSANVALKREPTGQFQIRVFNSCTTTVFIRKGTDSTVTAAATDLPIAPGSVEVLTLQNNPTAPITYLAMISPSGSCTLYVTAGVGF